MGKPPVSTIDLRRLVHALQERDQADRHVAECLRLALDAGHDPDDLAAAMKVHKTTLYRFLRSHGLTEAELRKTAPGAVRRQRGALPGAANGPQ